MNVLGSGNGNTANSSLFYYFYANHLSMSSRLFHHHYHGSANNRRKRTFLLLIILFFGLLSVVFFGDGAILRKPYPTESSGSLMIFSIINHSLSWLGVNIKQNSDSDYYEELSDAHLYKPSNINKTWPYPRFHLLVDARKGRGGEGGGRGDLCRTLLSAVVQGYPPPILVGHNDDDDDTSKVGEGAIIKATLRALESSQVTEENNSGDDAILWLGRDHWFQLPVEVLVRRYLQQEEVVSRRLKRRYRGSVGGVVRERMVLFPASKSCCCYDECDINGDSSRDMADLFPESTLPRDVYGVFKGDGVDDVAAVVHRHIRPRFLYPGAFMGRARDVVPFLKRGAVASKMDGVRDGHGFMGNETCTWADMFLEQEQARKEWEDNREATPAAEFGMSLDYESRIFQDVSSSSIHDLRLLTFGRPSMVKSPSRSAAHLYDAPIRLPPELHPHRSPLAHIGIRPPPGRGHNEDGEEYNDENKEDKETFIKSQEDINQLKGRVRWATLELITNVLVPRGSVPAVLNARQMSAEVRDMWWDGIWLRRYGRLLLHEYLHSRRSTERRLWNARGGRGGVWTDRGEWLTWDQVCGGEEVDAILFGGGN
ncbi:hypothetical protein B0T17DRAFT_31528 [Bombardia bombarda]|uniref:Uncharacterized protein n=1 Tax=Bombardia bombarda TaxID=252184 RepID=A0AA39XK32_9PEZI|nr:hypothetical protein B0T17DRAFT_31528 [Bombardia bombarda]